MTTAVIYAFVAGAREPFEVKRLGSHSFFHTFDYAFLKLYVQNIITNYHYLYKLIRNCNKKF